jgi:hypothetical protein
VLLTHAIIKPEIPKSVLPKANISKHSKEKNQHLQVKLSMDAKPFLHSYKVLLLPKHDCAINQGKNQSAAQRYHHLHPYECIAVSLTLGNRENNCQM